MESYGNGTAAGLSWLDPYRNERARSSALKPKPSLDSPRRIG